MAAVAARRDDIDRSAALLAAARRAGPLGIGGFLAVFVVSARRVSHIVRGAATSGSATVATSPV